MEQDTEHKKFQDRTNKHIKLVFENMKKLEGFKGLTKKEIHERGMQHDADKFSKENVEGYIVVNKYYRHKNAGTLTPEIEKEYESTRDVTKRHVENNLHHPEAHKDINEMKLIDIAEMCCDHCAMSQELGGTLEDWYNGKFFKKFNFNDEMKKNITECAKQFKEYSIDSKR